MKVVVRHLPPELPEDVFRTAADGHLPPDSPTSFRRYDQGKLRKEKGKESTASRAYIDIPTEEAVMAFAKAFHGHTFADQRKVRSVALVEMAPFAKVPPPVERRKVDLRQGTIEEDPDYIAFLERLGKAPEETPSQPAPAAPTTTPLLEHLRKQRTARAEKAAAKQQEATAVSKSIAKPPVAGPSSTAATKPPAPSTSQQPTQAGPSKPDGAKRSSKRGGRGKGAKDREATTSPTPSSSTQKTASPQAQPAPPLPAVLTSASTPSAEAKTSPASTPKPRAPPRGPRLGGNDPAADASRRLMGGLLGQGGGAGPGGRLAKRRAAEKAAKERGEELPPEQAAPAGEVSQPGGRGRGRGRGGRGGGLHPSRGGA